MPYHTVRRSGRLSIQVPILLLGTNVEGRVFSENTHTVVLSHHGAGIVSAHTLASDQEMILRSLESNRETGIRILGEIGADDRLRTYGVAFVDESLDFWDRAFPLPPGVVPHVPLYLECSLCNSSLILEHGDFEFDVCAIHGGLVRYCDNCTFATVWKVAAQPPMPKPRVAIAERETVVAVKPVTAAEKPSPHYSKTRLLTLDLPSERASEADVNRRYHRRAPVNYCACVQSDAFGDDIVDCIDMSRGGVGFKTKNSYLAGTAVRIAVPYSREVPQMPAIFVAGRIATLGVMPGNEFFRCGVAFLPMR